ILNEKTAASQMRGGAVMGIGQALLEATTTDRETARILNPGLNEYLVPSHADVPVIDIAFIEERDENINVLGVKGFRWSRASRVSRDLSFARGFQSAPFSSIVVVTFTICSS